jgi:hypothetical protein
MGTKLLILARATAFRVSTFYNVVAMKCTRNKLYKHKFLSSISH